MAEFVHRDVVEQILIRLDVKDLIRFKSVCKSWHSVITSSRFINCHLNHSYNKDHYDNEFGSRRISLTDNVASRYRLVGSSNGLVCLISLHDSKVLVGNPSTREVKQMKHPPSIGVKLCWGFGYDSSKDDYKVMVGAWNGRSRTCVHVLSLTSNVWRVTSELKHSRFIKKAGILSNGALHWIIKDDQDEKNKIISYDISKEEYKEIPQPDDARYECTYDCTLGIIKECLCIFRRTWSQYYTVDIWLMKKYNSWELLPHDQEKKYDIVNYLRSPTDERIFPIDNPWFSGTSERLNNNWDFLDTPIFVQSLVSPHVDASII